MGSTKAALTALFAQYGVSDLFVADLKILLTKNPAAITEILPDHRLVPRRLTLDERAVVATTAMREAKSKLVAQRKAQALAKLGDILAIDPEIDPDDIAQRFNQMIETGEVSQPTLKRLVWTADDIRKLLKEYNK